MENDLSFIEVYNWRNFKIGKEYIHCYGNYCYDNDTGSITDSRKCSITQNNKKLKNLNTKKKFPKSFFTMQGCHVYHKYEHKDIKAYDCFVKVNNYIYVCSKIHIKDLETFSVLCYYDFNKDKCFFDDVNMDTICKLNFIVNKKLDKYLVSNPE